MTAVKTRTSRLDEAAGRAREAAGSLEEDSGSRRRSRAGRAATAKDQVDRVRDGLADGKHR